MDTTRDPGSNGSNGHNPEPHQLLTQGVLRVYCRKHKTNHHLVVSSLDHDVALGAMEVLVEAVRSDGTKGVGAVIQSVPGFDLDARDPAEIDRWLEDVRQHMDDQI